MGSWSLVKPDCKRREAVPRWPCRFGISVVGVDNLVTDVIVDGRLVQARKAGTVAVVKFLAVVSVGTVEDHGDEAVQSLHKGGDVEKCRTVKCAVESCAMKGRIDESERSCGAIRWSSREPDGGVVVIAFKP